jgi:hypothetical protein
MELLINNSLEVINTINSPATRIAVRATVVQMSIALFNTFYMSALREESLIRIGAVIEKYLLEQNNSRELQSLGKVWMAETGRISEGLFKVLEHTDAQVSNLVRDSIEKAGVK